MSEARTIWHDLDGRQSIAVSRQRIGLLLVAAMLIVMSAAEVAFLRYVVGPDTVNMVTATEGMGIGVQ